MYIINHWLIQGHAETFTNDRQQSAPFDKRWIVMETNYLKTNVIILVTKQMTTARITNLDLIKINCYRNDSICLEAFWISFVLFGDLLRLISYLHILIIRFSNLENVYMRY
jgi:hypothetical protein